MIKKIKPLFENIEFSKSDFYGDRKKKLSKLLFENIMDDLQYGISESYTDSLNAFFKFKKKARKILKNL